MLALTLNLGIPFVSILFGVISGRKVARATRLYKIAPDNDVMLCIFWLWVVCWPLCMWVFLPMIWFHRPGRRPRKLSQWILNGQRPG